MHIVPWMLLAASLLFWISGPVSRWLRRRSDTPHAARTPAMVPLFLALLLVNFYIGYFGAGAGFLAMSVLALFGVEEMNAVNSLKVLGACLANFCAVVTFICGGAIVWHYCLVSMVAAAIGGYTGAQYAAAWTQTCCAPSSSSSAVPWPHTSSGGRRDLVLQIFSSWKSAMSLLCSQSAAMHLTSARIDDLGYAAALLTTAAYVPQLVRVLRLRSARDISLPTFLMFAIGVVFWLLYGLYTGSRPIIASNSVTLVLAVSIVFLKLRYDRNAMREIVP